MADETLLPCPFCGGKAVRVTNVDDESQVRVFCGVGACAAFYARFATVEQWNTRALTNEVTRLREALAQSVIPYEAILMDAESRRWIAPEVWSAIEDAVTAARAALQPKAEQ